MPQTERGCPRFTQAVAVNVRPPVRPVAEQGDPLRRCGP